MVSLVPPQERDSGSPVPPHDAGPAENDASAPADSPDPDASPAQDAPADTAPNPSAETGPTPCAMQLDPTFGVGGISTLVNPPNAHPAAIAFEPDGKILVGVDPSGSQATVARFDSAGALDPSYGVGGFAILSPPGGAYLDTGGLVALPDGKSLTVAYDAPSLARLNPDGTIDRTFGGNGPGGGYAQLTTLWPNWWHTLAVLGDGSILVGGAADFSTGGETMFLAKYDRDGVLDTSFAAGGWVNTSSMGPALHIVVQPDGTFIVAGATYAPSYPPAQVQPALERYTASGALDASFGSGGTARAPASQTSLVVAGMVRQSTGAIVLSVSMGPPISGFLLLRYTAGGQIDPTFGQGGAVRTDFFGSGAFPAGLSLEADDSLLVAGSVYEPTDAGNVVDFGIARYTADGRLDSTFAPGGTLVTRFPQGGVSELDAQGLQPDGKLVVAGYGARRTDAGSDSILTLARYSCP